MTTRRKPRHRPPVVIHMAGPSGAGKTTFLRRLQRKFPKAVVKDLDYFTPKRGYRHWASRQRGVVVLGGHAVSQVARDQPAGMQKILLNVGPIRTTWRSAKRQYKQWPAMPSFRDLRDHYRYAKTYRTNRKNEGYRKMRPRQIEQYVGRLLKGNQ